jgi:integrase
MPSKRLTEVGVAKIKPPPMRHDAKGRPFGTVDYFDAHTGLVLRVNYGGRKTWRALYYVKGVNKKTGKPRTEPRTRPLGRYPKMSVKEARLAAKKFDPQTPTRRGAETFKQVADDWVRDHVEQEDLRSRREIVRQLETYVLREWEHSPINNIRRRDVYNLVRGIKKKNGTRMATAVLGTIHAIMKWHAVHEDEFSIPFTSELRKQIDPRKSDERKRKHWLNDDEIRALFKACDHVGRFGVLTKVLLLTGQRLRKCAHMRWDDISADGVWTIPTVKGEKGNVGKVKLPNMVLDWINALPRVADNPHVFPAAYGGGPVSAFGVFKQVLDKHLPSTMRRWRFHDLRRTARKLMSRAGVRPDVGELALGHSIEGIRAVYDDPIEYRPLIEHALECVANEVNKILNPLPPNVVPLPPRGRRQKTTQQRQSRRA